VKKFAKIAKSSAIRETNEIKKIARSFAKEKFVSERKISFRNNTIVSEIKLRFESESDKIC